MKNITSFAISALLVISSNAVFAGKPADSGSPGKVDICHFSKDENSFERISVSTSAVQKHLDNHGDVFPTPVLFITQNDDPIWSNVDAQSGVCAVRCEAEGGSFTGAWWTTVPGQHSVCQCASTDETTCPGPV